MSTRQQFIREEDGQDVVEYGLLISTISLIVMLGMTSFASAVAAWFATLANKFVALVG